MSPILFIVFISFLYCGANACNDHGRKTLIENNVPDERNQAGLRALGMADNTVDVVIPEHRCGTPQPSWDAIRESARILKEWMACSHLRSLQPLAVEIETYFHVITDGSKGAISNRKLNAQLAVMNQAYEPHGFSFTWMGTTRTNHSDWYNAKNPSDEQLAMKKTLRRGDSATLNVYFSGAAGKMGYATSPQEYAQAPEDDGVVVSSNSIPGGSAYPYNEGKSLVHEIGHWLGLYHTFHVDLGYFQNMNFLLYMLGLRSGCDGAGDHVDDTPAQKTSTTGCPAEAKDTCPALPGRDAIHNYMDYSSDACMWEFTPGQADRMWALWSEYRAVDATR